MASLPNDLISVPKLAVEWGCTPQNANASVRRWKVRRYFGKQVSRSECEGARVRLGSSIQAEKSAKAWGKTPAVAPAPAARKRGRPPKSVGVDARTSDSSGRPDSRAGRRKYDPHPAESESRSEAERLTAWLKYENEKLDYEERQKNLLPIEEIRKTFQAIGRMSSNSRENLPKQMAPLLVGKSDLDEIEQIIRRELRAADERVANEIEAKYGTVTNGDSGADSR